MNPKRLVLAIVVVFIGIFASDYFIHGIWLKDTYAATASLWRSEAEMQKYFPYLLAGQFLCALMFVLIWVHAAVATLARACAYGLCMALFKEATTLILYAVQPFPAEIAIKWFVAGLVQGVIMGILVFLTYKPKRAFA